MKRKVVSALAVLSLVAMLATPAMADLVTPHVGKTPAAVAGARAVPTSILQFGVVTGGGGLTTAYSIPATTGTVHLTFGFYWPYSQPIQILSPGYTSTGNFAAVGAAFSVIWDTTENVPAAGAINVVPGEGFQGPGGAMAPGNYSPASAATILTGIGGTTGTAGVGLFVNVPLTGTHINASLGDPVSALIPGQLVKFLQLDFTIVPGGVVSDGFLDLFITGRVSGRLWNAVHTPFSTSVISDTTVLGSNYIWVFGGGNPTGISLTPEPASMGLLGVGCLVLTGGFWRRRKRLS